MDVRFIIEGIILCYSVKILLLTNVAFAITFSKSSIILARFIWYFLCFSFLKRINKFTATMTQKLKDDFNDLKHD